MCQQILIDLPIPLLKYALYILAVEDSTILHRDGFGFIYEDNKVYKTKLGASLITNLGENLNEIKLVSPLIAHVRLASRNTEISDEKAHPFESKDLILTHNGTLEWDTTIVPEKDEIDSQTFLRYLQISYSKTKNLVEAIKETYTKNFYGKFSFLIREKNTNKTYVIRGDTAKLFQSDIILSPRDGKKPPTKGCVINTDDINLEIGLRKLKNLVELMYPNAMFKYTTPKEIEKESIYLYDNLHLEKLSDIKEKNKPHVAVSWTDNGRTLTIPESIMDFCDNYVVTLWELDKLFFITMKKPMIRASEDDITNFYRQIIIPLRNCVDYKPDKARLKIWDMIQEKGQFDYKKIYTELNFPWFINTTKDLITYQRRK